MSEVVGTTPEQGRDKYHKMDCGMAEKTSPELRERLKSIEAAEEEGFRPCGVCFRSRYREWRKELMGQRRGGAPSQNGGDPGEGEAPHERGLFTPKFVSQGDGEIIVAIDSRGRKVAEVNVTDQTQRSTLLMHLRGILDALDPKGWQERKQATERRGSLELVE